MKRKLGWSLVVVIAAGAVWWHWPASGPTYRGRTAAQWEAEIARWVPVSVAFDGSPFIVVGWSRIEPEWHTWLREIGFFAAARQTPPLVDDPPLMDDPQAVPFLIEVLGSKRADSRMFAVNALHRLGRESRTAVPSLIGLLDDPSFDIVVQVEEALKDIDPETWNVLVPPRIEERHRRYLAERAVRVRKHTADLGSR